MKNLKSLSFVFTTLILLNLASCKNNNSEQLTQIDSLQTELANVAKIVANINEEKNNELEFVVDSNIKYFSKNFKDSLQKEDGLMFQNYKVISKEIKRFNIIKKELKSNIDLSINQLEKLKKDYTSGSINQKQFEEYFAREKQESEKLINVVKEREKTLAFEYKTYDSLNPLVIEFNKKIKIK